MVFGFFRKKKDTIKVALEVITGCLQTQLVLTPLNENHMEPLKHPQPLGYIYGFTHGITQALKINDEAQALRMQRHVHISLFGIDGIDLLKQSLQLQNNSTFSEGRNLGQLQAQRFIKERTPPMGLAEYVLRN